MNDNTALKPGLDAAAAYLRLQAETLKYAHGMELPSVRKKLYRKLAAEIEALEHRAPVTEE